MWQLEISGRGRRSKVDFAVRDNVKFCEGDLVKLGDVVGIIAQFKQGESASTHSVEILLCIHDNLKELSGEIRATSVLKWYGLNEIDSKVSLDITEAIDHRRLNAKRTAKLGIPWQSNVHEFAKYVAELFIKSPSPNKRGRKPKTSPKKRALNMDNLPENALKIRNNELVDMRLGNLSDSELDSDEYGSDFDEDPLPKRKQQTSDRGAHRSTKSMDLETKFGEIDLNSPKKRGRPRNSASGASPSKPKQTKSPRKQSKKQVKKEDSSFFSLDSSANGGEDAENDNDNEDEYDLAFTKTRLKSGDKPKHIPEIEVPLISSNVFDQLISNLHPASDPPAHPCRDSQFDQLFYTLETAIQSQTGMCIYVSGTPGTGKTSTVREVISQLALRVEDQELKPFSFIEINGMKLVHPSAAYEHLWEVLGRGQLSVSNSIAALESAFSTNENPKIRGNIVVLLDEVDQLVTKNQQLMYNFFNWPALEHSRLVVIAIANTMDLPERMLSNKVSSRLGLTRIQFPGYTHQQLEEILKQRVAGFEELVSNEAIEFTARKVAGVGGDARQALDLLQKALATEIKPIGIPEVRDVVISSQEPPLNVFLRTLGVSAKVFLCALVARTRINNALEVPTHEVLNQASQFVKLYGIKNVLPSKFDKYVGGLGRSSRLKMFQHAIAELLEAGVLVQQAVKGEATPNVRLMVPKEVIKTALDNDKYVSEMI